MAASRRVLYVTHNHPSVRAGGSEVYALGLYEAMREADGWEPLLLARSGPPMSRSGNTHVGTLVGAVNDDPAQYFFFTDLEDYDWLNSTMRDKATYTRSLRSFLLAHQPDVVHFQHTLLIGYEALRETRNTLPDAAIVYTLHEYLPICHNHGQMIRTFENELCDNASPRRCNECFPDIAPQTFFLRQRFLRACLDVVDLFIAPSAFLLERYVAWGIPRERIIVEENGSQLQEPSPSPGVHVGQRGRLGFFGQLTPFKGADILVEAMALLEADGVDAHLWLNGSNLELQPPAFRHDLEDMIEKMSRTVTMAGGYDRSELPALLEQVDWVVVPSIWWENSPLVIQEAFMHGRPVICSDIGGMAEKVIDGVNGLHFRAGDPIDLAAVIRRAVTTEGLWDKLCSGIPAVHPMADHVDVLTREYARLLSFPRGAA